jgi:four helix bundle protein
MKRLLVFGRWFLKACNEAALLFPHEVPYMTKTGFQNLQIYKLSEKLADQIWDVVVLWENLGKDTLGKQLIRAVDSIGANIAEGSGRGSDAELRRYLRISRGSLYETKHWLRRAYRRKLLTEQ